MPQISDSWDDDSKSLSQSSSQSLESDSSSLDSAQLLSKDTVQDNSNSESDSDSDSDSNSDSDSEDDVADLSHVEEWNLCPKVLIFIKYLFFNLKIYIF